MVSFTIVNCCILTAWLDKKDRRLSMKTNQLNYKDLCCILQLQTTSAAASHIHIHISLY